MISGYTRWASAATRRGSRTRYYSLWVALLFAAYLLTTGAFVIIAATLAGGGLINSDKCDICPCQPGLSARDVLS